MTYSLEQLRGFIAVAEELHFGRAAVRLRMTQPPLSRQIQKLEAAVGVQLLERDNRRVRLTPAGHAFLNEARRILAIAEAAPALAQRVSSGMRGVLKLGFTSASTFGHLGRILDYLNLELPEVHIELFEMVTREQIDALTAGDIDLGLARPPFDPELFESRLLHREALLLAVHEDHPLADLRRAVVPADLVREPLIFHSQQKARYFYDLVVSMVPLAQERIIHTVSQVMTMLWLVSRGRGVAFVPESAGMIAVPHVEYLRIDTPIPEPVELHVLWPRKSDNPALPRAISALSFMMH
ncbi:transcriptional regulator [Actinoplanes philippinensis]|uniref:DNA-binding transcriptional regulator, LysR family n=1 Tax=Actinoplanes philippinensis TaxID=35752 RepID=A0A1I2AAN3_9ACTN|nr:LysR family transcriptional regulator [Actinoplanes philippinensis]GIE74988.1 transcriptional regulator [Actinoplanes philippinensis]SFE40922.1 DNA-binding transcriptional regulator, LysR family [Actinoplanes philippinensis]